MTRPRYYRWMLAACLLAVSLLLGEVGHADAWRRHGHNRFHFGMHYRYHRRYPFHHHHGFHSFFGLHYYPYPYHPYSYYVEPYYPGEHRRFPAFRMPAFLHYPGALGKGEKEAP